jgi:hypothetical protein
MSLQIDLVVRGSSGGIGGANLTGIDQDFETVLIDTSHTREVDRRPDPSQSIERIWERLDTGCLFMPSMA